MKISQNEITGAYYEDEPIGWLATTAIVFFGVTAVLAISLAVLDLIFGAERVTEVIVSLF